MESSLSIFISHDKEDETLALLLKGFIESIFLNASVFVSSVDLSGGNVWIEELRDKLAAAKAIIAVVTPRAANSSWILFEAGAGFCARKTIPLLADGATFESIDPPLKLLQGRYYTEDGLKQLLCDIAKAAQLRTPARFGDLEATIREANAFLTTRREVEVPAAVKDPNKKVHVGHAIQRALPDQELQDIFFNLQDRARKLLIRSLERARAAFDIPPAEKLETMSLNELDDIADAVNAPHPTLIALNLGFANLSVPEQADSAWKKINARNRFDSLQKELDDYEASLGR
jgi:hypothetical protein